MVKVKILSNGGFSFEYPAIDEIAFIGGKTSWDHWDQFCRDYMHDDSPTLPQFYHFENAWKKAGEPEANSMGTPDYYETPYKEVSEMVSEPFAKGKIPVKKKNDTLVATNPGSDTFEVITDKHPLLRFTRAKHIETGWIGSITMVAMLDQEHPYIVVRYGKQTVGGHYSGPQKVFELI